MIPTDSVETFDVVIVGGGPAGATAARELAGRGRSVLLLDRGGRIKPCGGAIPPRLIEDFEIPDALLVARVTSARMVAPSSRAVDMPIGDGFVGMVDRDVFDEWLRERAAHMGAVRRCGTFESLERDRSGRPIVHYRPRPAAQKGATVSVRARVVIGADGANSTVARLALPETRTPFVFAYHEIVRSPTGSEAGFVGDRCDVYYQGAISPDFYGWIFPHGATASIGMGTAVKGFPLRGAVAALREATGLAGVETIRREGAPIPLRPLPRWDNGRDVVLAGDAAGVVAPASGEGIYYAMTGGQLAAEAADAFCHTGDARVLRTPRKGFMRAHGQAFWILGVMQSYWYRNDRRREHFVSICGDQDVQRLTWDAYMNKRLSITDPMAHFRIFCKNIGHMTGLIAA